MNPNQTFNDGRATRAAFVAPTYQPGSVSDVARVIRARGNAGMLHPEILRELLEDLVYFNGRCEDAPCCGCCD